MQLKTWIYLGEFCQHGTCASKLSHDLYVQSSSHNSNNTNQFQKIKFPRVFGTSDSQLCIHSFSSILLAETPNIQGFLSPVFYFRGYVWFYGKTNDYVGFIYSLQRSSSFFISYTSCILLAFLFLMTPTFIVFLPMTRNLDRLNWTRMDIKNIMQCLSYIQWSIEFGLNKCTAL